MFDDVNPANQNVSFTQMTRNPDRGKARSSLSAVLCQLEMEGIHPQMLTEALFELLMIEMEPDDPITSEKSITWFSQLHRFRDRLQEKIDTIDHLYEETHS